MFIGLVPRAPAAHLVGVLREVIILAFDGFQPLDVTGPFDAFTGATEAVSRLRRKSPGYRVRIAAPERAVRADNGLTILADTTFEALATDAKLRIDTLVVAGGGGARRAAKDAQVVGLVGRLAKRSRRIASVCTGTFPLAAAGILDGLRATTHWAYCEKLAKEFPAVDVESDPIFVRDGRVWTSAGVTAGIDLSLAMIEDDLGQDIATQIARWLVVFVRRAGGQSQFSAQLSSRMAERKPVRELQSYIVEHPAESLDVAALAERTGMSVRNFSRVFTKEVGLPPARYVERVRVETARRILETSASSIDEVASLAGFENADALRRAFRRRIGVMPREYRARFGPSAPC